MRRSNLLLIFDLDGTLIDSSEDLAISVNAALAHVGRDKLSSSLIHSYIGNGAPVLIRRALGEGTDEELEGETLAFFLKFYRAHALEHTRLYQGIRDILDDAHTDGQQLAVLTNKPARISVDIIAALRLQDHFFRVYGGDSFASKKPDPFGIHVLLQDAQVASEQAVMIGDSSVDIQAARNAGVRSCGVLWGFQPESFQSNPPDVIVREASELRSLWQTASAGV